jgi:hypothetical protein
MANSFLLQTVIDGPRNLVIKATGVLDTSDLAATLVVLPSTTFRVTGANGNPPPRVRLNHIDYSIANNLEVITSWGNAGGPLVPILPLAGRGRMSFDDIKGLPNNAPGTDGSIWLSTSGWTAGTLVFSLVFELIKEGLLYDGGAR